MELRALSLLEEELHAWELTATEGRQAELDPRLWDSPTQRDSFLVKWGRLSGKAARQPEPGGPPSRHVSLTRAPALTIPQPQSPPRLYFGPLALAMSLAWPGMRRSGLAWEGWGAGLADGPSSPHPGAAGSSLGSGRRG